jgi:hypothetical protein
MFLSRLLSWVLPNETADGRNAAPCNEILYIGYDSHFQQISYYPTVTEVTAYLN